MTDDNHIAKAQEIGRRVAVQAEALRAETVSRNEELRPQALEIRSMAAADSRLSRLAVATRPPVLIAEGDSWFDYPGNDILDLLEDVHRFEVFSVAHQGHRLEEMAYEPDQFHGFVRKVERVASKELTPVAVLLSAGGNDVAGTEFELLLNHARSPNPGLNPTVVEGIIDQRLRDAYVSLISAMTQICEDKFGETIPVVLHGYAHVVPDGRGFWGGWGPLPGPWLRPGFRHKGYPDDPMDPRTQVIAELIDRFNAMLQGLEEIFDHLRYVDLRPLLSNGPDYKDWWSNELHPTRRGFETVTEEIARVLTEL
jgi:hypothetical protein